MVEGTPSCCEGREVEGGEGRKREDRRKGEGMAK